jgi:hypothetical protein
MLMKIIPLENKNHTNIFWVGGFCNFSQLYLLADFGLI